jgi:hypothetical protein
MKFIITEEMLSKCTEFGKNSVGSSADKYASRNQYDIEKIMKDIRNGKIAEQGVYEQMIILYPHLTPPDYNIYSKKDKSWDPDLKDVDSNIRLAVKSQDISSALSYGESWVFQYNHGKSYDCDTGIFKDSDDNHYVAFVLLNVPKRTGEIRAIVKVQWLHDKKLFKEMKKQSLRGNKLAIYFEDLEGFADELWQIKNSDD